mmetsp:Transcript_16877/g.20313  ORF Transcript_16877/g.20313 Transcript_16877/m.20313 type:complete len:84 (-) Transcript_16877:111-362(-)
MYLKAMYPATNIATAVLTIRPSLPGARYAMAEIARDIHVKGPFPPIKINIKLFQVLPVYGNTWDSEVVGGRNLLNQSFQVDKQ